MAQIIFRRGSWYSDFRLRGKRIRRPLSKDRREAQIALGRLIEKETAEATGRPDKNISWADFKKRYIGYSEGSKRPKSVKRDRAAISALEKAFPLARLDMVTPEILESWKGKRLKDGIGKPTVNRDVNAIKALLHKAEAWGYLEKRNWGSVKEIKTTRRKLYFHTPAELGRLLSLCRGVWRTICLLGARAGLRREEMFMLTWEDVDFERNRLHVTPKDGWEPKDYEQRFIGLAPDLRAHLEEIRPYTKGRWVVAEKDGSRPSLAVMSAYFQKLTRKAKLRGSLHILRHTFASHLVQAGESLKVVKDLLGHSSMETTEIYAELAPENIQRAALRLPDIPGSVGSAMGSGQSGHRVRSSRVK